MPKSCMSGLSHKYCHDPRLSRQGSVNGLLVVSVTCFSVTSKWVTICRPVTTGKPRCLSLYAAGPSKPARLFHLPVIYMGWGYSRNVTVKRPETTTPIVVLPSLLCLIDFFFPFHFFFFCPVSSQIILRRVYARMPQTGNQTSLYNKLVITFVAIGGTVSLAPRIPV
jgi:hypothetical protein